MVFWSLRFCTILCLSYSLTKLHKCAVLKKGHSCRHIYEMLTINGTEININGDVHGFQCRTDNQRYHCISTEDDKELELCVDWIWMELGNCPTYVTYGGQLHAKECNASIEGCPSEDYESHLYYKYQNCFLEGKGDTETPNIVKGSNIAYAVYIGLPVVLIALVGIIILCIWKRKRREHDGPQDDSTIPLKHTTTIAVNNYDAFENLKEKARYELETFGKKVFVPLPRVVNDAKRILSDKRCLIITGERGCGKSSLARFLMSTLRQEGKFTPIEVLDDHLTDFGIVLNRANEPCVVLFNCNVMEDDETIPEQWFTVDSHLLMCKMSAETFTKRKDIVEKLGRDHVIDLSSEEYSLTKRDKYDILRTYECAYTHIKLNENDIYTVSEKSRSIGFYLACWNYFGGGSYENMNIVKYFDNLA